MKDNTPCTSERLNASLSFITPTFFPYPSMENGEYISIGILCWQKTVAKGCVSRGFDHAIFDHVFLASRVCLEFRSLTSFELVKSISVLVNLRRRLLLLSPLDRRR